MRPHIRSDLTAVAQPAKPGWNGRVLTKIKNAIGFLLQPAVVAQGVKPFPYVILVLAATGHHFTNDIAQTLQLRRRNIAQHQLGIRQTNHR